MCYKSTRKTIKVLDASVQEKARKWHGNREILHRMHTAFIVLTIKGQTHH